MPELLSPAGNFEKLKSALLYGADAVYLAGSEFGMRAASENFGGDLLKEAVRYTHERNKKIYVTINTMPHVDEYARLEDYLHYVRQADPDGVIISDLGVFMLAKKILTNTELHVSTQASCVSHVTADAWYQLGAQRVVLARELTLREIQEIREKCSPSLKLEAFIHGSMCVSYSGRCLLSNFFTGRDANRGQCAQPCRWEYSVRDIQVSEVKRPDIPLPIEEYKNGTFVMSSKDMCMIDHIPELMNSGIDSFKIEGRVKSAYYAAVTTNTYRHAMDLYTANPATYSLSDEWKRELNSVSHREYCTGFYFDTPSDAANTCTLPGYMKEKTYFATAIGASKAGEYATFIQKNKFCKGDSIDLLSPGKTGRNFIADDLCSINGEEIESTPHPFMEFKLRVPFDVHEGDILRAGYENT